MSYTYTAHMYVQSYTMCGLTAANFLKAELVNKVFGHLDPRLSKSDKIVQNTLHFISGLKRSVTVIEPNFREFMIVRNIY
jgi:hypothetical protein